MPFRTAAAGRHPAAPEGTSPERPLGPASPPRADIAEDQGVADCSPRRVVPERLGDQEARLGVRCPVSRDSRQARRRSPGPRSVRGFRWQPRTRNGRQRAAMPACTGSGPLGPVDRAPLGLDGALPAWAMPRGLGRGLAGLGGAPLALPKAVLGPSLGFHRHRSVSAAAPNSFPTAENTKAAPWAACASGRSSGELVEPRSTKHTNPGLSGSATGIHESGGLIGQYCPRLSRPILTSLWNSRKLLGPKLGP